jgi:hypothetical protein
MSVLETWVKLGTLLVAVVGAGVAVNEYIEARGREIVIQTRESQKPFLELQLRLYAEASETTAKVATLPDGTEREAMVARFWQLYWGPLSVVESPEIEAAMVRFGEQLERDPNSPALRTRAIAIAHAIRDSVKESWKAQLRPLAGEK